MRNLHRPDIVMIILLVALILLIAFNPEIIHPNFK